MEDGIPLIFQQLPATTAFVQSPGDFFFLKPLVVMGRIGWGGGRWGELGKRKRKNKKAKKRRIKSSIVKRQT